MDSRPLMGRRVVNTRGRDQAASLTAALSGHGAEVIEMPMIAFAPAADPAPFHQAIAAAEQYDWIVFTSANGVRFALESLRRCGWPAARPAAVRIAAVGPRTADALREAGLPADRIPADFQAAGLVQAFSSEATGGLRILLVRGQRAAADLPDALRRLGAAVDDVVVYRTERPPSGRIAAWESTLRDGVDVVAFTSGSTVDHFIATFGADRVPVLLGGAAIACIGPITAAAVRRHRLACAIVPPEQTTTALVAAIVEHLRPAVS